MSNVSTSSKQDPEEWNRMWASAAFVGVLIVIGVPLWWKTTEVYRVSLPYDEIRALSSLQRVAAVDVVVMANDQVVTARIAQAIADMFNGSDTIALNIKRVVLSDSLHHTLLAAADDEEAAEAVTATYDQRHNLLFVVQRTHLTQDVWLGPERVVLFRDELAATTLTSVLHTWILDVPSVSSAWRAGGAAAAAAWRTRLPPTPHYNVLMSVAKPPRAEVEDGFKDMLPHYMEAYIGSFVNELSDLHNFTLKSQWLHMFDYQFQGKEVPSKSSDPNDWPSVRLVRESRLHGLITKVDSRAATQVSSSPTINLLLYIQPCETPIMIADDNDQPIPSSVQAFLVPKWGGAYIAHPPRLACQQAGAWEPNVRLMMGAFIAQMKELLGFSEVPPISGATVEPAAVGVRAWQLDGVLRARTAQHVARAISTLTSLAQLLGEISNIVINAETGAAINKAVQEIHLATEMLAQGDIVLAYKVSQSALLEAEAAFTDPSLLALLYFPDDQKYAVYIPLFLPIMFPVVLSLKNLFLWFRGKPKEKTD